MNIYIGTVRKDMSYLPILYPHLGAIDRPDRLFFNFAGVFTEKLFDLVLEPEQADYLMIPHDYFSAARHPEYVAEFAALAKKHKKTILIFDHSDLDDDIDVAHSIVFRVSQYFDQMKPNEIIMPPIIEDLGRGGLSVRKKSAKPVVGFCGWAGFRNWKSWLKYAVKSTFLSGPWKPGLYYRRAAIMTLTGSKKVLTNFVIRKTYSGHKESIELDPQIARKEYVDNINESDFVLAPKGDGNYSNRFYEIMSLGRIPVLIDTECVLPLEDEIDYDRLVVRLPYSRLWALEETILKRYAAMSNEEYAALQVEIRGIFEQKLNVQSYFKRVFSDTSFLEEYKQ